MEYKVTLQYFTIDQREVDEFEDFFNEEILQDELESLAVEYTGYGLRSWKKIGRNRFEFVEDEELMTRYILFIEECNEYVR